MSVIIVRIIAIIVPVVMAPRIIRIIPEPAIITVSQIDIHIYRVGICFAIFKIFTLIIIAEAGQAAFVLTYFNFFDIISNRISISATVDNDRLCRIRFIIRSLMVSYMIVGLRIEINVIVIITTQSGHGTTRGCKSHRRHRYK